MPCACTLTYLPISSLTFVYVSIQQVTRSILFILFAQIAGIAVTLVAKILVLLVLRRFLFSGFFRKQPAAANVLLVVLECWSLALTAGTMLARLVKFMLITGFYIARIDTPMLVDGVGSIGPVRECLSTFDTVGLVSVVKKS